MDNTQTNEVNKMLITKGTILLITLPFIIILVARIIIGYYNIGGYTL